MTLFKQIALLVSLMFLLLASIIMINNFIRTSQYLQGQLQTTAQDMTTTLGIAISNLPTKNDEATLEVLFNSVFDSGYYSSIKLVAVDGSVIHQKSQEIDVSGVPDWFFQLVPLTLAKGETQVMQGWTQLGHLSLSLHPGYAYSGLYDALVSTLKWFAVLLVGAILLLWLLLHYLLLPLQRVKEQADSIHSNQFVQQKKIPATLELKSVVEAMNRMVSKVQGIFNDQEKTLFSYQQLLYHDKLTGLGNRKYMLEHLSQAVSEGSSFHGSLGVIRVVNFDQVRERCGYQQSDDLAKKMAEFIGDSHAGVTAEQTARLSDDEFAFLISADEDTVSEFAKSIFNAFKTSFQLNENCKECYLIGGVSALEAETSIGDLLSGIDCCLSQANSRGPFSVEKKVSNHLDLPQGKMNWREWLEDILNSNRIFLVGQTAVDSKNQPIQKELFIRTRNEQNQIVPASAFMPMASSLGMALEFDKAVFGLVENNLTLTSEIPLAVNLSSAFFEMAEAQEEFNLLLLSCHERGIQLCIEASHYILQQHPVMCSKVSDKAKN
ncbi:MAG: diguanylate cyclase, partial [Colwellia sp.]|nr:diguanylate cyclase [Colwellia sp.]